MYACTPYPFTICSWNACSLLARAPSIQLFLHEHHPSILIIIEPMINSPDQIPSFPYYSKVYIPHLNRHKNGGLVIYFHISITYHQNKRSVPRIASNTATSIAIFHISSSNLPRPFILVPIYISSHTTSHDWHDIIQFFNTVPTTFSPGKELPTLIIGDMNARDPMWDNQYTPSHRNTPGQQLAHFLSQDNDWHLLNLMMPTLTPTHYPRIPGHEPSVIDLALANDFNLIESFSVLQHNILLSDHAPIMSTLICHNTSRNIPPPTQYIWNVSRRDIPWDIFHLSLEPALQTWRNKWELSIRHDITLTQDDIDTCWNELKEAILSSAHMVIGKKAVSIHHKHWFNIDPSIPTLHRTFIQLHRKRIKLKQKQLPIPPTLQHTYVQARHDFKTAMKNAKTKCWEELVEQVSKNKQIIWTAWHKSQPSKHHPLPPFQSTHDNDPPCVTPIDNLNIIARHFQSISTLPADPSFNRSEDLNVQHTINTLTLPIEPVALPFNKEQLANACQHMNTNTAAGPDDISPHFIKHASNTLITCLFIIFHICYQHGMLASEWTEGKVIALYKHIGDKHDVTNYRPINVTSVIIRLFEKLMLPTLQQHMHLHHIPSHFQYGFTKHRSTYDAILRLLRSIGCFFSLPIPAIFIDISKAYDRVWVHGLIHKLYHNVGLRAHTLFFYKALLSNRTFRVYGNGHMSDIFNTPDGVPQGAVSSPHLFTIYIHDLVALIESIYIHMNMFADDIVIWASAALINNNPIPVMQHMQTTLDKLSTWASTWKVTFSSTKTQMIIFCIKQNLPKAYESFTLTLSSFNIAVVDTYRYLGVTLHKRLQWKQHIQEVIRNATATSQHITRMATYTTQSRPSIKIIRQLLHTVLIPKIVYGLPFILLPPNDNHILMRQLKRLLIIPLRKSLGLTHNAHHESIFIETRTLPIHYLQLHCSLLLAKRYIFQVSQQSEQQQRYDQLFLPGYGEHTIGLTPSNPLSYLRTRCLSTHSPTTATISSFKKATSKQIWHTIFQQFYNNWYTKQHRSFIAPEPHSLYPCYVDQPPPLKTITLPQYLTTLSPSDASIVSRLRFNRARLNQSLFKRHKSTSDKCPSCPDTTETVEHVIMSCPRYDRERFQCLCALHHVTNQPPLSTMFPFPFLLCSFPSSTIKAQHPQLIKEITTFLRSVSRLRNM